MWHNRDFRENRHECLGGRRAFATLENALNFPPIQLRRRGSLAMLKLAAIFAAVFLAELGDKTQLATLLFASDRSQSPVLVFLAASAALVVATGLAVVIGSQGGRYLEMVPLKLIAGIGFVAIGGWSILEHFRA
jgi:putative Ca2+/H+ antiporter (TMEM165/GDT1 family)